MIDRHKFDISSGAQERLEIYHALLLKWQKAVNLVSSSSLDDAWERHFNDSIQLAMYIDQYTLSSLRKQGSATKEEDPRFRGEDIDGGDDKYVLADLGSGAGFPGLVLAILRPELEVHLIESAGRKCEFLRTVSRETDTPITIHNERVENMAGKIRPDLITARALAGLEKLCTYCRPFTEGNPGLIMLFLKGEKLEQEIADAQKTHDFNYEILPSRTAENAGIVKISGLMNRA